LAPTINAIDVEPVLEAVSTTPISASVVAGDVPVERVWAQVISPDADITGGTATIDYPEVELAQTAGSGPYEGLLEHLNRQGLYKIVVNAQDSDYQLSEPTVAYISVIGVGVAGDVDLNGTVNLADAVLAARLLAGFDGGAIALTVADVDGDGKISLTECFFVLQRVAGWRTDIAD
jgi:hypothetical protein